jgi:hypothetical protein
MKYEARCDYVIVRKIDLGKTPGGLIAPNISALGKELRVESIGPDVDDLDIGDKVILGVNKDSEYYELPEKDLAVVRQSCVVCVIGEEK